MRYIIKKTHSWQKQSDVFKILDTHTGQLSFSSYLTYDRAKKVVLSKNSIISTKEKE